MEAKRQQVSEAIARDTTDLIQRAFAKALCRPVELEEIAVLIETGRVQQTVSSQGLTHIFFDSAAILIFGPAEVHVSAGRDEITYTRKHNL